MVFASGTSQTSKYSYNRVQSFLQVQKEGHLIRIQSDNAKAMVYINHQGGARSLAVKEEIETILA